jgi:hypothetical protein
MRRTLILLALLVGLGLLASPTFAQETVFIQCTGSTVCGGAGGNFATQSTTSNPVTFTVSNTDGTKCPTGDTCGAYLAILTKNNGTGNFTSSSASLWAALGEVGGQDNTFTPWATTATAAGAGNVTGFTVTDQLLGTFTTTTPSFNLTETVTGAGEGFAAFYEDCGNTITTPGASTCTESTEGSTGIVNNSKLSESLITGSISTVPEPVSMLLFGTGLVALGAKFRRRKSGNLVAA